MATSKIVKRGEREGALDLEGELALDLSSDFGLPQTGGVIRKDVHQAMGEAQKVIEQARVEALRIKKGAENILRRVEEEREAAKREGFEKGKEEGMAQVTEMLVAVTHKNEKMFEGLERELVNLVYDIAEKVISRDLSERESAVVDLIRQALSAAMGDKIVILVNPADLEAVKKHQIRLMQTIDASKTLQIRADEKVAPKGCLIETEIGTIDAQLNTQLEAIRKALGIE